MDEGRLYGSFDEMAAALRKKDAKIDRLLSSVKELRDALAGAMRSMDDGAVDRFVAEMSRMEIPDGVGVRADRIVKELSDDRTKS